MTSSKIRGFQTPSPLRHLPQGDFRQKCLLWSNLKLPNQDLALNIIQNKNQSTCCWLNVLDMK